MANVSPEAEAARRPDVVEIYKREYIFKRIVDYMNTEHSRVNGPVVTTSMARQLRAMTQQALIDIAVRNDPEKYGLTHADGSPKTPAEQAAANVAVGQVVPFRTANTGAMAFYMMNSMRLAKNPPVKGINELISAWREDFVRPDGKPGKRFTEDVQRMFYSFDQEFEQMYASGVIPVSPYAPDVSLRDAFMDGGTECRYISRTEFESGERVRPVSVQLDQGALNLYATEDDARYAEKQGEPTRRALKNVSTVADRTGFARLRPYLSEKDYKAITGAMAYGNVSKWDMTRPVYVKNGERLDAAGARGTPASRRPDFSEVRQQTYYDRLASIRRGTPREQVRGGPVVLERAEAILRTLRDEGIPFTIRTNGYDGQVTLVFDNDMELRLIDAENPGMSGIRMYQNGRVMLLKADRRAYDDRLAYALSRGISPEAGYAADQQSVVKDSSTTKYVPHLDASPEESVAFVKYVLGRPVSTFGKDKHIAGRVAPIEATGKRGRILYKSAHSQHHFYADLGTFERNDGASFAMCVDYDSKDHSGTEVTAFPDGVAARDWLINSVRSARTNFLDAVNIEELVGTFAEARSSGQEILPTFSVDKDVSYIQRQYWDILTGAQEVLVRPGHDMEGDDGDMLRNATYEISTDENGRRYVTFDGQAFDMDFDENDPSYIPPGRVEMIRRHLLETIDYSFGSFEKTGVENKRFNPAYVARFMDSPYSLYRNIDDVVSASRTYIRDTMPSRGPNGEMIPPKISDSFTPDDLRGDDFTTNSVRERLVVFDETKSRRMDQISKKDEPFLYDMYRVIKSSLESNGCIVKPGDIEIDENFVVRYNVESLWIGRLHKTEKNKQTGQYEEYEDRNEVPPELLGNVPKSEYSANPKGEWVHTRSLTGFIGRIIPPNEDGMVFDGKYFHAPGYTATIRPNRFGEDAPYEARLVLKGYAQSMAAAIRSRIRTDTLGSRTTTGDATAIDNVLRHLYDVRYGADFYERTAEDGLSPELRSAIVKTNTQRIKIDSELMDNANRVAIYQNVAIGNNGGSFGGQGVGFSPLVDNDMSPVTLAGGRNIAINESFGDGYVDPKATGNGGAQGVRYLPNGAVVNIDGSITPAPVEYVEDENGNLVKDLSKVPVCAANEYMRNGGRAPDCDAVDRENMTFNGLLHCMRETDRVGVAQMSFGGWTLEDGLVVSKKFAEKYMVPDASRPGAHRPLIAGDKIECHGNKGVVSIVIDPDMSDEDAAAAGILEQVKWMRANPEMDVVMSPYSHVSRFNSGLGVEAMGLAGDFGAPPEEVVQPADLVDPNGKVLKGCLGHAKFTILEQTADVKTHFEEDGTPKRSYGAQAGWALAAADCPNILRDSFEDNSKALIELRELLITCGMDLSSDGKLLRGYHPQPGEERNVITTLPLTMSENARTGSRVIRSKSTTDAFMEEISRCGGFVEIPFKLEFPRFDVGDDFEFADGDAAFNQPSTGFLKSKCDHGNRATIGVLQEMPHFDADGNRTFGSAAFGTTYKLPIMSAIMRSGQDFEDGKAIYHDWSNAYKNIYNAAVDYQAALYKMIHSDNSYYNGQNIGDVDIEGWLEALRHNEESTKGFVDMSDAAKVHKAGAPWTYAAAVAERDRLLAEHQRKAQAEFDRITEDIVSRKFESKHNIFRTGIMANKQQNSATAIWTGDPRRKVDEVGMNPDMMKALGIKEGEYVMLHRDPILRDGGMRYMKAVADPRLAGISVNPAGIPKSMDGDFDGDTIGVHKLGSEAAKKEAMKNLSVYANLLDSQGFVESSWNEATHRYDRHRLFIAGGQDIAAGLAGHPELQKKYDFIELAVNKFENDARDGKISDEELMRRRMWAKDEIDTFLTSCYDAGVGHNIISYESPKAHLQTCLDYVNDKAKGSPGKVAMYAENMGLDVKFDEDKKNVVSVEKKPGSVFSEEVREVNEGISRAKNMQTQYTGFGGMFSIRAIRALYNVDPKAALELTYVVTQAVLQVKHDSPMADRYEQILSGPARYVWQGYKLEKVENEVELKAVRPDGKLHKDAKTGEVSQGTEMKTSKVPVTWRIARDDKGKPIMATRAEFVEQIKDVYGNGMDLAINQEFVHRIADLLCEAYDPTEPVPSPDHPEELKAYRDKLDQSKMMSIEDGAVKRYGAPLQRLAYGASLSDIAQMATENEGLFDVPTADKFGKNYNGCYMDKVIMQANLEDIANNRVPSKIIAQPDVLVDGEQRTGRALLGSKLVKAVKTKSFHAEAERVDGHTRNPNRGVVQKQEPQLPQETEKPKAQVVKVTKPTKEQIATVMSGKTKVDGVFKVPESGPSAQAAPKPQEPVKPQAAPKPPETPKPQAAPHVPGSVFPNGNTKLGGMNLSKTVEQNIIMPEPVEETTPEVDDAFIPDEETPIPESFENQPPSSGFGYVREVREADDIEKNDENKPKDGPDVK